MPGAATKFNSVIDKLTCKTKLQLLIFVDWQDVNLTKEDLNSSIDQTENQLNIHLVI